MINAIHGKPQGSRCAQWIHKHEIEDDGNMDPGYLAAKFDEATQRLADMLKKDIQYHKSFLEDQMTELEQTPVIESAKDLLAVKALQRAENQAKIFRK